MAIPLPPLSLASSSSASLADYGQNAIGGFSVERDSRDAPFSWLGREYGGVPLVAILAGLGGLVLLKLKRRR